ncbi:hypothetical protein DFH07DRAFT_971362 [Mycena maculata]|uniref:F-box domain-containing protein n=1 Tax=Mycena maculata TaxID=230809 RepID=A0AAD7HMF5_9AGAR|nr:hypothetical protein DFH07DRAFT_971362 [Mycena maculata]
MSIDSNDLDRLPNELLYTIFFLALFCPQQAQKFNFNKFAHCRHIICSSSSQWMRFLRLHPVFWTYLSVRMTTNIDVISAHVARSQDLPIHLHVSLDCLSKIFQSTQLGSTVTDLTERRFARLRDVFARAITVFLSTDNAAVMRTMHIHCCTMAAPLLKELVIRFPEKPASTYRRIIDPATWFKLDMHHIETVHIHRTPM